MHPYPKGERGNSFLAQGATKASQGELVKGSIALRPTPIPAKWFEKSAHSVFCPEDSTWLAREADFATKPSVLGLPAGSSSRLQVPASICDERYIGTDDFDPVSIP